MLQIGDTFIDSFFSVSIVPCFVYTICELFNDDHPIWYLLCMIKTNYCNGFKIKCKINNETKLISNKRIPQVD